MCAVRFWPCPTRSPAFTYSCVTIPETAQLTSMFSELASTSPTPATPSFEQVVAGVGLVEAWRRRSRRRNRRFPLGTRTRHRNQRKNRGNRGNDRKNCSLHD